MNSGNKNKYTKPDGADNLKIVDNEAFLGVVEELIKSGREVKIPVSGGSMTPFLIHRRDSVILFPIESPLKKGDVVLYRRNNGMYVLHRIVRVKEGDVFDICGDAQREIETGVKREDIFARAGVIERKGKLIYPQSLFWKFFSVIWIRIIPLRRAMLKFYGFVRRVLHK